MKKQITEMRSNKTGQGFSRRVAIITLMVAATALCTAATFATSSSSRSAERRAAEVEMRANAAITPTSSTTVMQQGPMQEVRISLSTNGFNPAEVTHSAGPLALVVENQNLSGEYVLQLKASDGTVLKEVTVQKGSSGWGLDLQAGTYTLTEANHPEWTCSIIIQ